MNKLFKELFNGFIFVFVILRKSFTYLAVQATTCARSINILISKLQEIPKKVKPGLIFKLIPIKELSGFSKIMSSAGGVEHIALPRIVGLSNGGSISVNMPDDYLCKLDNISFVPYSDFLRDGFGNVSNEKLLRKEYDVLIPRDTDIIKIEGRHIKLSSKKTSIHIKIGFSLMGTYSYHWAHFFAQYYPKLNFLNKLPSSEEVNVIIPEGTDPHIKFLIKFEINKYRNVQLIEVNVNSEIICEKLYHVSLATLVADEGFFPTPFSILISKSTLQFWKEKALELMPKESIQYRKIYLERTGGRSLKNNDEIKDFFIDSGFEVVFPHLLSIQNKIKIFSEAKYLVGPGSSAFVNCIYSKPGTKILAFINSFRYLDTYLPEYSNFIGQEFWFMSGKDEDIDQMNSSYTISLDEIGKFIEEHNFFDNLN